MTVELKALDIARRYMKGNDVSHDIAHVCRVVRNAKKILSLSSEDIRNKVDIDILVSIAALHDCLDKKYVVADAIPAMRAVLINEIVSELGFDLAQAEFILKTVDNISYSTELLGGEAASSTCAYLAIARDADRLESIGAIGAARCFAYSAAKGRLLATESFEIEKALRNDNTAPHNDESAICHFHDKLVHLLPRFRTKPGREMAEQRHNFILSFLDQIHSELD